MSESELLAKLREQHLAGPSVLCYDLRDYEALALLTSWRDEAVRAERDRALRDAYNAACGFGEAANARKAIAALLARTKEPEQHG